MLVSEETLRSNLRSASLVFARNDVGGKELSNYFWRPMTMIGALPDGCAVDLHHIGQGDGRTMVLEAVGWVFGRFFPRKLRRDGIKPATKEILQRVG